MARGKRPVSFRTRKLSLSAPMVLPWRRGGRVGRRRTTIPEGPPASAGGPSSSREPDLPHRKSERISGASGVPAAGRAGDGVTLPWRCSRDPATVLSHTRISVRAPPTPGGATGCAPVTARAGTAAGLVCRRPCAPTAGSRAEAEPAGGDRADHRPRARGCEGRRAGGRAHAVGAHGPHAGRRHGRHPGAAGGGAGGGDLSRRDKVGDRPPPHSVIPGEVFPAEGVIETFPGAPRIELEVSNSGDRPVQVGSHFHFARANRARLFGRAAARGHRPDIAAGTAVRFEPGITRTVTLVPLAGARVVPGLTSEGGLS